MTSTTGLLYILERLQWCLNNVVIVHDYKNNVTALTFQRSDVDMNLNNLFMFIIVHSLQNVTRNLRPRSSLSLLLQIHRATMWRAEGHRELNQMIRIRLATLDVTSIGCNVAAILLPK